MPWNANATTTFGFPVVVGAWVTGTEVVDDEFELAATVVVVVP